MSEIVLSASVRQNLLSLQSTAQLLSTTQNRLATGNKVNSALDNPTNYFTAQSLNARANDINNLLDGIGNGVQILQAANTGITSLSKLVDTAKSIANQSLQTQVGYTGKSNVSATIGGAVAGDLRGTTTFTNAIASSNVLYSGAAGGITAAISTTTLSATAGALVSSSAVTDNVASPVANITVATRLYGPSGGGAGTGGLTTAAATSFLDGDMMTVNGHTITFKAGTVPAAGSLATGSSETGNVVTDGNGNSTVYLGAAGATTSSATVGDLLNAIDLASGTQYVASIASGVATLGGTASSIAGGIVTLRSSTGADLDITGKADSLAALKFTTAVGGGQVNLTAARATAAGTLGGLVTDGSTLHVNGKTITFRNGNILANGAVPTGSGLSGHVVTDGAGNSTILLQGATVADMLNAIDLATGTQTAAIASGVATLSTVSGGTNSTIAASGVLKISTGLASDLSITATGNALTVFGLAGNTGTAQSFNAARTAGTGSISGKTMTFTSFNGGTAVNVTFGDGTGGTIKTLDQLNVALAANNMVATLDSNSKLTISAGNDYASSTLGSGAGGTIGGTVTSALVFSSATAPVADLAAQAVRSNLVTQYNNVMQQIDTTAQSASFNGVNLLYGDQLKLTFDETGRSTLNISGMTNNIAGLGLATLTANTDFIDNASTNHVLTSLNSASALLRSQASALGSNLSVVQIRQDFSKNLINVLQTGASNLTIADTNEEAANSQALSTRQSIAVSALALANQAQQSVLRLLQ